MVEAEEPGLYLRGELREDWDCVLVRRLKAIVNRDTLRW